MNDPKIEIRAAQGAALSIGRVACRTPLMDPKGTGRHAPTRWLKISLVSGKRARWRGQGR
jgi:hypothetical protein